MPKGYSKDAAAIAALVELLPGWTQLQVESELAIIRSEDGVNTAEAIQSLLAEWYFDNHKNARLIVVKQN